MHHVATPVRDTASRAFVDAGDRRQVACALLADLAVPRAQMAGDVAVVAAEIFESRHREVDGVIVAIVSTSDRLAFERAAGESAALAVTSRG